MEEEIIKELREVIEDSKTDDEIDTQSAKHALRFVEELIGLDE